MNFLQEYGGAVIFLIVVACLIGVTVRSKMKSKGSACGSCGSGCDSCGHKKKD